MTAVPALPTVLPASGKITSTNWDAMVNLFTFMRNPPRFKGSILTATAITANTPIKYPSIYDTASGWNASTGQYTFQYAGTYTLNAQMKWGAVTPGIVGLLCLINGTASAGSVAAPNSNSSGPWLNTQIQVAAGDVLTMQVGTGFTTLSESPSDNNFLILTWTGS